MQPSRVLVLAFLISCSVDRHATPPSIHNPSPHVQAPQDQHARSDAGDAAASDVADGATKSSQPDAAVHHSTSHHSTHKDAGATHAPGTASSDAAAGDAAVVDATTPAVSDSGVDGSIAPTGPPDALRGQLVALLRAAQFMNNERAIVALVAVLATQAQTSDDVDQILTAMQESGRCAAFGAVVCAPACQVIAQRCSMCAPDAKCAADLQSVCGGGATTCP